MTDVETCAVRARVDDHCFIARDLGSMMQCFKVVEMTQLSPTASFTRDQCTLLGYGFLFCWEKMLWIGTGVKKNNCRLGSWHKSTSRTWRSGAFRGHGCQQAPCIGGNG